MPKGHRKAPSPSTIVPVNSAGASSKVAAATEPVAPFDLWLERGLHKLYDDIAQEPIPDALLDIIEQDRQRK